MSTQLLLPTALATLFASGALLGCPGQKTASDAGVASPARKTALADANLAASGAAPMSVGVPLIAPASPTDAGPPPAPADARRGLYRLVRDQALFTECGSPPRVYEVRDAQNALGKRARELFQYGGEALYAEVGGEVEKGPRQSAGLEVQGVLAVKDVYRLERKSAATTCLRFDYWLVGSEPAWTAQVSEAEGLVDFHHDDIHKSWHFDFVRPQVSAQATEWKVSNPVWKTALEVKVHKAQCTTGTDQRYDYRATVTLGKTVYKGCAQPWK